MRLQFCNRLPSKKAFYFRCARKFFFFFLLTGSGGSEDAYTRGCSGRRGSPAPSGEGDGGGRPLEKFCPLPEAEAGSGPPLRRAPGRGRRAAGPVPGPPRGRRGRRWEAAGVAFTVPLPVRAAAAGGLEAPAAGAGKRTDMFGRRDMVAEGRSGGETGPARP